MNRKTVGTLSVAAIAAAGSAVWLSGDKDSKHAPKTEAVLPQPASVTEKTDDYAGDIQTTEFIEPLSDDVTLLIRGTGVSVRERERLAGSLSRSMHGREQEALMGFISGGRPDGFPSGRWHGIVDVVMNTLRRQHQAPDALTETLINVYHNSNDVVLQDYAIQHLRSWYVDRGHLDKHENRPEKQELILQTLLHAVGRNDKNFSGTALLALDDITTAPQLADDKRVQAQIATISNQLDQVILDAVSSQEANKHLRIDALQLCARRGLKKSLPTARLLAVDKNTDPSLRISAIALIGAVGNLEEDGPLLKSVTKQSRRYEWAAEPALKKLSNQL